MREENFSKGENDALVSRCTNENKKRKGRKNIKESVRERCTAGSISVDRIPKRKRSPASAPIGGGGGGPFTKSRDADRRVFMFAPRILPRRRRADEEMHVRPCLSPIFMNLGYALLEQGPKRKTTGGVF